jgi:predicted RecA/RadA family phage recombinase
MPTGSATFVHHGDAIDYTPEVDTPAGTVVVIDTLIGVAKQDIKAGELGALHVTGVFDFPKPTGPGTGSGAGINVYWNDTAKQAEPVATNGRLLGKSIRLASDDDTTFRVRLTQ